MTGFVMGTTTRQHIAQRTVVYIDQSALQYNYQQLGQWVQSAQVMAMVKGNAYGHGLLNVAQAISNADAFGVATFDEAWLLRHEGFKQKIVLLSGVLNREELIWCAQWGIDIVVHDYYQVDLLAAARLNQAITVWLKVDTGMHRLGFTQGEIHGVHDRLRAMAAVAEPIHLMTHFPSADNDQSMTRSQIDAFYQSPLTRMAPCSLANSAGVLEWPQSHGEWVRVGGLIYGISPKSNTIGEQLGLCPAMRVCTQIITIKHLPKGARVGYHQLWQAPEAMTIGILAMGYGDGYPWSAPIGTPVLINGKRCPIVGAISMDFIAVDLRPVPEAQVGDEAVLWGSELPVERVAQKMGVNPYSLVSAMGARSPLQVVTNDHIHDESY